MNAEASGRARTWLVMLIAVGEMSVGALITAFPSVGTFLIGARLDAAGLVITRMMGVALLAIGLTWWLARGEPACSVRHMPGFILYNIGVGALFAHAAMSAPQPLIPWIVAIVHIAAGMMFVSMVALGRRAT